MPCVGGQQEPGRELHIHCCEHSSSKRCDLREDLDLRLPTRQLLPWLEPPANRHTGPMEGRVQDDKHGDTASRGCAVCSGCGCYPCMARPRLRAPADAARPSWSAKTCCCCCSSAAEQRVRNPYPTCSLAFSASAAAAAPAAAAIRCERLSIPMRMMCKFAPDLLFGYRLPGLIILHCLLQLYSNLSSLCLTLDCCSVLASKLHHPSLPYLLLSKKIGEY